MKLEPAIVRGLIVAIVGLLTTFGVSWAADLTAEQIGYLTAVVVAVAPIVQGLWTRFAVTPNALVVSQVTRDGTHVVTGMAAERETGEVIATVDPSIGQTPVPALLAKAPQGTP